MKNRYKNNHCTRLEQNYNNHNTYASIRGHDTFSTLKTSEYTFSEIQIRILELINVKPKLESQQIIKTSETRISHSVINFIVGNIAKEII